MEKHTVVWRGITVEISFTTKKWGVTDHIELHAEDKTLLPVTETGYRSEYFPLGAVADYGDVAAFITAWLDHEATRKGWSGAQLSLF